MISSSAVERRFVAEAWVWALPVEASLRAVGLARTLAWLERVPRARAPRAAAPVCDGERLVAYAYKLHVVRGTCLPRSLVQHLVHRRHGVASRFVVGVKRGAAERGLAAHAWVEGELAEPGATEGIGAAAFAELFSSRPP